MPSSASPFLRILIVEDQPLDAELMIAALRRDGVSTAVTTRVETAEAFLAQLTTAPDVILCDYALPSFSALEALRLLKARNLDIPFIIVSGSIGEETAVEAIKVGADDYLLKDRLGRLGAAIMQAVEEKKLRAATQRAEEDLRQSEYKYRCLFEHLPDAAYLCDSMQGRIIDTNHRGERLLRLERAAILGTRLSRYLPETTCRLLLARTDLAAQPLADTASEITDAQNQRVPVRVSATVVPIYNRQLLLTFLRSASPP